MAELQQNSLGFRAILESLHDFLHTWIGGSKVLISSTGQVSVDVGEMNNLAIAAWDPIFFFHHSYVDYLYAEWQTMIQDALKQTNLFYNADTEYGLLAGQPDYIYDIKLQPYIYWHKIARDKLFDQASLYERSGQLLAIMSNTSQPYLKQGFIIEIENVPIVLTN